MTSVADILGAEAVAGDPGAITSAAGVLSDASSRTHEVAQRLSGLSAGAWEGLAAQNFDANKKQSLQERLSRLADVLERAVGPLRRYSGELASNQEHAQVLARQLSSTEQDLADARNSERAAQQRLSAAQRKLQSAAHDPVASKAAQQGYSLAKAKSQGAASRRADAERHLGRLQVQARELRQKQEHDARRCADDVLEAAGLDHARRDPTVASMLAAAILGLPFASGVADVVERGTKLMLGPLAAAHPNAKVVQFGGRASKLLGPVGVGITIGFTAYHANQAYERGRSKDAAFEVVSGVFTVHPAFGFVDFVSGGFLGDNKGILSGMFGGFYGDLAEDGLDAAATRTARGEYGPVLQAIATVENAAIDAAWAGGEQVVAGGRKVVDGVGDGLESARHSLGKLFD